MWNNDCWVNSIDHSVKQYIDNQLFACSYWKSLGISCVWKVVTLFLARCHRRRLNRGFLVASATVFMFVFCVSRACIVLFAFSCQCQCSRLPGKALLQNDSQQHTHMSSSYRSSRLGLSHLDPYAMRRGGCLEFYYCNMVEWSWWDSGLI